MLDKYNKEDNPFKLPENYFQDFESQLMDKIASKENKGKENSKIVRLKQNLRWIAAVAAVAVLAVVFVPKLNLDEPSNSYIETVAMDEAMEDEYYQFLEEELLSSSFEEAYFEELD